MVGRKEGKAVLTFELHTYCWTEYQGLDSSDTTAEKAASLLGWTPSTNPIAHYGILRITMGFNLQLGETDERAVSIWWFVISLEEGPDIWVTLAGMDYCRPVTVLR